MRALWNDPQLTPISVTSEIGGSYLAPSGPPTQTVVPHIHADSSVTLEVWDGVAWTTSPIATSPGGLYNYWLSFYPPSTIANNYGGVTPSILPQLWTTPVVSQLVAGKFAIAGILAGIPSMSLISSTGVVLSTVAIPGLPSHIAYDGSNVVVTGTVAPGQWYLSVYVVNSMTSELVLLKNYLYGVEVTSISLDAVTTSTPGVTRNHSILFITTSRYYLPGELVTVPGPVVPLSQAPPGDLIVYELAPVASTIYLTPEPSLLFSYRYGGLLSMSYSRRKQAIFALNETETVITFSAMWNDDGLSVRLAPESESVPGAAGVYVVDGVGYSQLLVYGDDRVIVYKITELPSA